MRKTAAMISAMIALSSCIKEDAPELFTDVTVTVVPPEGIRMKRFQGTMTFLNINSLMETSSSDFSDGTLEIRLLKGVYRIGIAEGGGIRYEDSQGNTGFREVTTNSTPVNMTGNTESVEVGLILK